MFFPQGISRLPILTPVLALFLVLTSRVATSAPVPRINSTPRTITASLSNVAFGNLPLGRTQEQFETLTNSGTSTVTLLQAAVAGTGFGVRGLTLPLNLSKGQSITFTVLFTPWARGLVNGTVSVVASAPNPKIDIALSGTGVSAGQLTSSAATLNFGSVPVGTSKTLMATLAATGSSVTITSATSTSAEFHLSGVSLPQTIAPGQSASVFLTFTPASTGAASASISLTSNAANTMVVETLSGSGGATPPHLVNLRWSPSSSAVLGYNVYRSSRPEGPYTKINPAINPTTSFQDGTVQSGATYYYVSTAINTSGAESKYSNQMQAVIPNP